MELCPQCNREFAPNRLGRPRTFCTRECQVRHLHDRGALHAHGRPPIPGGGLRLQVVLPPDLYLAIELLAQETNTSLSNTACTLIEASIGANA